MPFDILDFHAHILPRADHGSDSVETSKKQLRFAYACGVRRIIATPHFYPNEHSVSEFFSLRDTAYRELLASVSEKAGYPEIRLGCEVLYCEGISRLPRLEDFCISGTRTILLELPFSYFSERFAEDVRNLISMGYEVVLAHADRYSPKSIDTLLRVGAKIQLNAESLAGLFVPKHIKSWLKSGAVVAIGSDIHMRDSSAYKRFVRAAERIKAYPCVLLESDRIWRQSSIIKEKQLV